MFCHGDVNTRVELLEQCDNEHCGMFIPRVLSCPSCQTERKGIKSFKVKRFSFETEMHCR